jgi:hypothetical protein
MVENVRDKGRDKSAPTKVSPNNLSYLSAGQEVMNNAEEDNNCARWSAAQ